MDFETVWKRILENEGQIFLTKKEIKFKYQIHGNSVRVISNNREINQNIGIENFRTALNIWPVEGPATLNVRGQSYIWGILNDERICPKIESLKS